MDSVLQTAVELLRRPQEATRQTLSDQSLSVKRKFERLDAFERYSQQLHALMSATRILLRPHPYDQSIHEFTLNYVAPRDAHAKLTQFYFELEFNSPFGQLILAALYPPRGHRAPVTFVRSLVTPRSSSVV